MGTTGLSQRFTPCLRNPDWVELALADLGYSVRRGPEPIKGMEWEIADLLVETSNHAFEIGIKLGNAEREHRVVANWSELAVPRRDDFERQLLRRYAWHGLEQTLQKLGYERTEFSVEDSVMRIRYEQD